MAIHPTAVVSSKAKIHESVEIGPYVIIDDHVEIGEGSSVLAHAYITGHTRIGKNNEIHMGAVVGHEPQDLAFDRAAVSYLEIGDNNVLREHVAIHRGTKDGSKTTIGNNNFIMGHAHIAHNATIGNNVIIVNNALIAGHARIDDQVFISGCALVHQFVHVGRLVMLGGGSRAVKNVPPFMSTLHLNVVEAINIVGLRRAGLSKAAIKEIKECYKIFYLSGLKKNEAVKALDEVQFSSSEAHEFVDFIKNSERPIATCAKKGSE